jgi:hypothetical protein
VPASGCQFDNGTRRLAAHQDGAPTYSIKEVACAAQFRDSCHDRGNYRNKENPDTLRRLRRLLQSLLQMEKPEFEFIKFVLNDVQVNWDKTLPHSACAGIIRCR